MFIKCLDGKITGPKRHVVQSARHLERRFEIIRRKAERSRRDDGIPFERPGLPGGVGRACGIEIVQVHHLSEIRIRRTGARTASPARRAGGGVGHAPAQVGARYGASRSGARDPVAETHGELRGGRGEVDRPRGGFLYRRAGSGSVEQYPDGVAQDMRVPVGVIASRGSQRRGYERVRYGQEGALVFEERHELHLLPVAGRGIRGIQEIVARIPGGAGGYLGNPLRRFPREPLVDRDAPGHGERDVGFRNGIPPGDHVGDVQSLLEDGQIGYPVAVPRGRTVPRDADEPHGAEDSQYRYDDYQFHQGESQNPPICGHSLA